MSDTSWHTDDYPELRSGPPWVMQEMIAAQPELAARMIAAPSPAIAEIAAEIGTAVRAGRGVTVTGCGTSEHAAHGVAALIAAALAPEHRPLVRSLPALSAVVDASDGLCLGISHEGGTRATLLAVGAAKQAGASTAAITAAGSSSIAGEVDRVLLTPVHDDSWCHTVAYTSALLAGGLIAERLGAAIGQADAARQVLLAAGGLDAGSLAEPLAARRVLLCAGAGLDQVTARELSLKIAEGARMPTVALELETVLHGQLAGHDAADGLILVAIDAGAEADRIARRAAHVAGAAAAIGMPVAALLSGSYDTALASELTPAGRLVLELPEHARLERRLAALLAGAGALQALTLALANERGTNPDLIRREEEAYRRAARAGEGIRDW